MRRNSLRTASTCSALALFSVLVAAHPGSAATFTVDTEDDAVDATPGDGRCATTGQHCSLRAAIQEANSWPGPDVVALPAGTYLISREGEEEDQCATGDLDVKSQVSITGGGAASTVVDANLRDRAFDVRATGAAVISGVTIRGGNAVDGGGIRVEGGTLKLVESAVSENQASDNGGGIDCDFGVLEVVRSTVSGNVAHNAGGGIANSGTATLRNATLSGNVADVVGGGLCNLGTATLNNTTVTANTLDGVDNDGQLVSANSLFADNAGVDCRGWFTSRGFNLIDDPGDCVFDGDTSGDLLDKPADLGTLQDNGGPTFTHALLAGSAALDAASPAMPGSGDPACETEDQRGVLRPQGVRCDIGAYEACAGAGSPDGAMVGAGDACVAACGDGVVEAGEQCDAGSRNGVPGSACGDDCRPIPPDPGDGPVCGDGILDDDEECDDGNVADDDGCDSACDLEAPLTCEEDGVCESECDPADRFDLLNCVLQTPMCQGERLPIGIVKRITKSRDVLALAWQADDPRRGKRLVVKALRMLKKADRIRKGVVRKGGLSPECAAALEKVLGKAKSECESWRGSF